MKPLNKKERSKAFIKVVGLFLLSFVIAILLGFSTMNMGKLSEQKSNAELERLKNNLKFQEEVFAPNVEETSGMLSKIPTANETGENLEVLNQDIAALLSRTKNQVKEDETWESKMYKDVIQALSDLQLAYNNQVKLKAQMGDSDDLGQKLQACITERDRLQTQLSMLQAGGGGGGGGAD
ncbi:MAG TPA: hypothetical protein ENN90_03735, partial [Mariniphaga anaerophila]|nr:hypothetical protein [Mariniphaga anaerophila]